MNLRSIAIDERIGFLHLARHAIAADGVITAEEATRLDDCRRMAGLIGTERAEDTPWQAAAQRIQNRQSRKIIFLALCGLLYADQTLDPSEATWIDEVRQLWDLDGAFATACLDLTSRQAALQQEAAELVAE